MTVFLFLVFVGGGQGDAPVALDFVLAPLGKVAGEGPSNVPLVVELVVVGKAVVVGAEKRGFQEILARIAAGFHHIPQSEHEVAAVLPQGVPVRGFCQGGKLEIAAADMLPQEAAIPGHGIDPGPRLDLQDPPDVIHCQPVPQGGVL